MIAIVVQLPGRLVQETDALAERLHSTPADVIRRAFEHYVYPLNCERDALTYEREPLTAAELALVDGPDGWSAAPPW